MYYVYLLKDPSRKWIYIGYTNNLKRRLQEHREGKNLTTKKFSSIELVYYEAYRSSDEAKDRESKLKQYGNSLGQLKKRINRSLLSA